MTISVAGDQLLAYLLASLRIIAWLVLVPPFSSRAIPAAAKVILALALALAAAPGVAASGVPTGTLPLISTALTQVAVGLAMGFVTFLLFSGIAAAGNLVDMFGGFALAQGFDPIAMRPTTIFGQFHQLLATVLLFATGGHMIVLGGMLKTFQVLPLGDSPDLSGLSGVLLTAFRMFLLTAVQIALPMIAVLLVADLGLALMTKIAPQLNALSVMFPAKIGLTLVLVGLSFSVLPGAMDQLVDLATQAMAAIVGPR